MTEPRFIAATSDDYKAGYRAGFDAALPPHQDVAALLTRVRAWGSAWAEGAEEVAQWQADMQTIRALLVPPHQDVEAPGPAGLKAAIEEIEQVMSLCEDKRAIETFWHWWRVYTSAHRKHQNGPRLARRVNELEAQIAAATSPASALPPHQDVEPTPAIDLLRDWLIQFLGRNKDMEAEGFPCREACHFVPEQARKLLMELGAALARRAPADQGQRETWQPIDTAPKDRHPIRVAVGEPTAVWAYWNQRLYGWHRFGASQPTRIDPTHWLPEPSVPAALQRARETDR